ncbi:hypothetical protein AO262_10160 [Pseudomonas fluorescens ABAC62]|nr:hypothetical protein AO262_10160 [Pseudomonas fluorescens ABAC62]
MLLHDAQKLELHAAGLFLARFPFFHRGGAGVQVTGEYRLANMTVFAQLLDLFGRYLLRDR